MEQNDIKEIYKQLTPINQGIMNLIAKSMLIAQTEVINDKK